MTRKNRENKEVNLVTRDNYLYLRATARNYARLLGRDLGHVPLGNTGACISDLYDKLAELEPSLHLNMEPDDNRLRFVFWKPCSWNGHTLYWIEMKFLETLSPKMREVAMLFFRKLRKQTRMPTLTTDQSPDLDWVFVWMDDQQEQGEWLDETDRRASLAVTDSYKEGGGVNKLMKELEQEPDPDVDLVQALSEAKPRKKREKELLEIMREGVRFTDSDSPSIFKYEYDPGYDITDDEQGIELRRIIRFVYGGDIIQENLIQSLNNDLQYGYGECIPCTRLYLTPDTDSVFTEDPFPSEFLIWIDKLADCVNHD